MEHTIELKVHADICQVKNLIDNILLEVKSLINENVYFNTKIILNELIINSVMHGNREDINKAINIKVLVKDGSVSIEIADEGCGIKYNKKSMGCYDLDEGGRGLMLVEGLSDEFVVDKNIVKCVQYLNK